MTIRGTHGDDDLTGTAGNDIFALWQGGNDTVDAGSGNDIIRMGAALNAGDKIDGGDGRDVVGLNGDYSAGLVFNADTMTNVEVLTLVGGHSYNLTLNDGNVAAGQNLFVKAGSLGAGDQLIFDGSAETDGRYYVVAGAGDDVITGGAQGDHIYLQNGGVDTANGGGGNDVFYLGGSLWSDDKIDGGAGFDTVHVSGGFAGGDTLALTATTMQNVEDFVINSGSFMAVITDDATVAAGATLTVNASAVTGAFTFDGSAETDGQFNIIASSGNDTLTGGAGNDTFRMGANFTYQDQIDGGAGIDTVILNGMGDDEIPFTATTMVNVEKLVLQSGHVYDLITDDATVAAGQRLLVDGSALHAADTLTFDGSAETDGSFKIIGGAGNDFLTGGANNDVFDLAQGGNDHASGGGGDDRIIMGAALTMSDRISGGAGFDTVVLNGGAAVTFAAATMTGVERLLLDGGHSYSLTTNNGTVASGNGLTVDASALGAGDTLTFNGAAETNGFFNIIGGAGNDVITGGQDGDLIDLSHGGNDTVTLGGTVSIFPNEVYMGAALTAADHIDGSAGVDVVILQGDYTGANAVVFDATTMVDVEFLELASGFSYDLTTNDANVSAGGAHGGRFLERECRRHHQIRRLRRNRWLLHPERRPRQRRAQGRRRQRLPQLRRRRHGCGPGRRRRRLHRRLRPFRCHRPVRRRDRHRHDRVDRERHQHRQLHRNQRARDHRLHDVQHRGDAARQSRQLRHHDVRRQCRGWLEPDGQRHLSRLIRQPHLRRFGGNRWVLRFHRRREPAHPPDRRRGQRHVRPDGRRSACRHPGLRQWRQRHVRIPRQFRQFEPDHRRRHGHQTRSRSTATMRPSAWSAAESSTTSRPSPSRAAIPTPASRCSTTWQAAAR